MSRRGSIGALYREASPEEQEPPLAPSREQLEDVEVYEDVEGWLYGFYPFWTGPPASEIQQFDDSDRENDPGDFTSASSGTDSDEATDDANENGDEENENADVTRGAEEEGEEADEDEEAQEEEPPFDPASVGLKEISNLASFTVSSYKPGCGVKELRDDDVNLFWQ